ncbi:MAG: type II toxin-antitoxin system PemK/MazF family toxin [Rectinemataceae bacterium]|nr:type II toxin-antitoxin system PemK/MazF family toxin [Rectinemataceae bacterium]
MKKNHGSQNSNWKKLNHAIGTVIIAPMTTKSHKYPTRIELEFDGKKGWIVLDQIRTVDKSRLIKRAGKIQKKEIIRVKEALKEMLID